MSNILITGGTGTIGKALVTRLVYGLVYDKVCNVTVFSRSEARQAAMRAEFPNIRYVIGDIRDKDAVAAVVAGHDRVIHAAAMKRIPECEAQPFECMKTNVIGSMNVVQACLEHGVEYCVGLSTDKACQPVTAYGASKLAMEKMFTAAAGGATKFNTVRYGNVMASTGSVLSIWQKQAERGQALTVTRKDMTRFWITPSEAVDLILGAMTFKSGTVLIPKMRSCSIEDMVKWVYPGYPVKEMGLRSLERLHEYLVSPDEPVVDLGKSYLIDPEGELGTVYHSKMADLIDQDDFMNMIHEVG